MRSSRLATRLTLMIAGSVAVAFAILFLIVNNSTRRAFTETQVNIGTISPQRAAERTRFGKVIEKAFTEGHWLSVQETVQDFRLNISDDPYAAIVVNDQFKIKASSEPSMESAKVEQRESGFCVLVENAHEAESYEFMISDFQTDRIRLPTQPQNRGITPLLRNDGSRFGYLVFLPIVDIEQASGRFARQVWRSAAVWIALTTGIAILTTVILLRRTLRPIDELTLAAKQLQHGSIPPKLKNANNAEFAPLIDAFNSATESIAQTEEIRKQLISDIAHELRTPLTNIKGQLEAAESGLIRIDQKLLATLRSESRLLERLVEDFQELAVSDAGQLRIRLQTFPLNEVCQNFLLPIAAQDSFSLTFDIDEELTVRADEERLRQVFGNMMENAIRHRKAELKVHVAAKRDGKQVVILFSDNGAGIEKQHQPFIFDRFYRAEKSRNRNTGGSGLGLSIVKAIIEAMSGSIRFVDDTKGGAKFEIRLPAE